MRDYTVILGDGTRKSVGVILPSALLFNTGAPEIMELIEGKMPRTLWENRTGRPTAVANPSMCLAIPRSILKHWKPCTTSAISVDKER